MIVSAQVSTVTLYAVACRICGQGAVDGEYFDWEDEADDARDAHIAMHKQDEPAGDQAGEPAPVGLFQILTREQAETIRSRGEAGT